MKVKLQNKTIEIARLPLGKYAELLNALDQLPKQLAGFDKLESDQIISILPKIIAKSLPEFVTMICIATPLEKEEVEKLGLDEVVDVVLAVIEVNNYKHIFNQIKNLTAQKPEAKTE